MDLVKQKWTNDDGKKFQTYLKSLIKEDKIKFTKRIVNTSMPVLAIPTPTLKLIAKEIAKGDYLSFLNLNLNEFYENTIINGSLILKIKDFNLLKKYLTNYSNSADNWASCDLLDFKQIKQKAELFELSKTYIKSPHCFTRRIGVNIWFKLIDNDVYFNQILNLLDGFYNESEYYVNMVVSWFVAECFIKRREQTLDYLKHHHLNKFTINKAIQKCRDSYRVTAEDKQFLLTYKQK